MDRESHTSFSVQYALTDHSDQTVPGGIGDNMQLSAHEEKTASRSRTQIQVSVNDDDAICGGRAEITHCGTGVNVGRVVRDTRCQALQSGHRFQPRVRTGFRKSTVSNGDLERLAAAATMSDADQSQNFIAVRR